MHAILYKRIGDNDLSWDLYFSQILVAIRFHVREIMNFSPFYLIYNWIVTLLRDGVLKYHYVLLLCIIILYYADDYNKIALQELHHRFTMVRNNLKKARKQVISPIPKLRR